MGRRNALQRENQGFIVCVYLCVCVCVWGGGGGGVSRLYWSKEGGKENGAL